MGWMETFMAEFDKTFIRDDRYKVFVTGFKNTLLITAISLIVGLIGGILIAIIRYGYSQMKKRKPVTVPQKLLYLAVNIIDKILALYVAVMRGVPLVVQLLIMAFVVMAGFPNKITVCCIAMGLNSAAYVSEVVRGGISSVDAGQMEAGRAVGLGYWTTMLRIVIPQAVKNILPTMGNEFIALIKETSVVSFVGAADLYVAFNYIGSNSYEFMVPYLVMAIIYIILVLIISAGIKIMERSLRKSDRRN